jgi:type II secretory pathway component HofQ
LAQSTKIFKHKEAEEKRLEQERERIRREEQAKAEREQQEKAAAERKEQERIAAEAKAKADREAAEKAAAAQREEAAKAEQAKPEPEPITFIHSTPVADREDYAWKIAGLVSTMTDKEKEMVLHYCERVIAQRKEAA